MLFHSLEFLIFLPLVFIIYWLIPKKNIRIQNLLILTSSYIFYGWWDWRFLTLIAFSSLLDYYIGIKIYYAKKTNVKKIFLTTSLLSNLGLLGIFKYYNFFIDNLSVAFELTFNSSLSINSLQFILPVGISFYTFQTMSYTIDIYNKKIKPTHDIIAFCSFVSFFPQLVAGPIERASKLLPQFTTERNFHQGQATNGLQQILWGFFKKIVIADTCATYADYIFAQHQELSGSTLFLGGVFFAFQIYGDFSGYSDIAIGTARLFGISLSRNFAYPYFSRDIAEFWRRWHISLSTWFRDYLYIPLGGSKGNLSQKIRNTFIIFIVSGFWHGANWTFIIWGLINAIYFLPLLLSKANRKNIDIVAQEKLFPSLKEALQISSTFILCVFAWIFFRSENLTQAIEYINGIFSPSLFSIPEIPLKPIILITCFLLFEWSQRHKEQPLQFLFNKQPLLRWGLYYTIIFISFYFSKVQQSFIYFQF